MSLGDGCALGNEDNRTKPHGSRKTGSRRSGVAGTRHRDGIGARLQSSLQRDCTRTVLDRCARVTGVILEIEVRQADRFAESPRPV